MNHDGIPLSFCIHLGNTNEGRILEEARYDGFYGVTTNLEDTPETIVKVNHQRWQIEECFRIMKSEFKARPVYLKNDTRTEITDALHEAFGFETDHDITTTQEMKKIIAKTKKKKMYAKK